LHSHGVKACIEWNPVCIHAINTYSTEPKICISFKSWFYFTVFLRCISEHKNILLLPTYPVQSTSSPARLNSSVDCLPLAGWICLSLPQITRVNVVINFNVSCMKASENSIQRSLIRPLTVTSIIHICEMPTFQIVSLYFELILCCVPVPAVQRYLILYHHCTQSCPSIHHLFKNERLMGSFGNF